MPMEFLEPRSRLLWLLFLVLTVGFPLGTLTLIGPVRWLATMARNMGWSQTSENLVVVVIIVALVLAILALAWWGSRKVIAHRKRQRVIIAFLSSTATVLAVSAWMSPTLMIGREDGIDTVAQFTFGPYPTAEKMEELKKKRYTAIVSLLHPAVVPFEPALLADERKMAEEVGIELIHLPMLPWVSSNDEAIARVKDLAKSIRGKYYVHCYLGRDRVNVAKRIVAQLADTFIEGIEEGRSITEIETFERGHLIHLADSVSVIPFPTPEEFFGFVLNGRIEHVLVMHEVGVAEDSAWLAETFAILDQYEMPHTDLAVSNADAKSVVGMIRGVSKPCVVITYSTRSPLAMELKDAYGK